MDPKTGEIYAMALAPSFDPNNLKEQKSVDIFQNDLVENVYEMGSIIKPLTMAVGIDTGKVTAQSTYNDEGSVTLSGKTMYNFDKKGRGVINYQLALAKSLNTGFIHIAQLVGNETMSTYFKKFALGEKTGIDLPNEGSGLISTLDRNIDVEIATAAFGQGIAMTPIETARALSTIANGGYLVTPHVVKKVDYRVGYTKTIEPKIGERVIKESTATAVTDMLINNVDTSLLDGKAKNAHYAVAAKTGTAQMRGPGGTYYDDRYLHSFVGFLPAKEPRFLVFMYTINPRGVQYASETLAQPFIDLTKFLINYYQLPPDR
jgi:cell division protein FtsI/penicillin-binding protein 2